MLFPKYIKSNYRTEIDGIRAFAVIAVMVNHFNKDFIPSGFLGVDIFFVISGYVITSSLARKSNKNFLEFLTFFYERRVKRLVPALVFFILPMCFLICFFNPNPQISLRTGISSLFGLSNLYLLKQATDYFAQSTELNIFTHTWSLGVEEQFYLIFPLLTWFTGFSRQTKNGPRNLFILVSFLSLFSLISFVFIFSKNISAAYFLMPTRFWEMAIGCITFLGLEAKLKFFLKLKKASSFLVLFGIIGTMFLPISLQVFTTILIVALSVLLISCLKKGTLIFDLFTKKKVVNVGLISYSLYLWHWGIISLSRWTIGIFWWTIPFQILIIYLVSTFSYKQIEVPLRRKIWSIKSWETIFKAIFSLILSTTTIFGIQNYLKKVLYLGNSVASSSPSLANVVSATEEINAEKCHGRKSYSSKKINSLFENCKINHPTNTKNKTIAFVGDSHALSLMSAQKYFYEKQFNLIHYTFTGCPFPYPKYGLSEFKCNEFNKISTKRILGQLSKDDYLVIYNYHLSHLGDKSLEDVRHQFYDSRGRLPSSGKKKLEIYAKSLIDFAARANAKKIKIIFIGPGMRSFTSILPTSEKQWFRPFTVKGDYSEEYKNASKLNADLRNSLKGISNLIYIDPLKVLSCCKNSDEYYIYYRDSDHLSIQGVDKLVKNLLLYTD